MSARLSTFRTLSSPEETAALARGIAPVLQPGDTLLLEGPIGAGKTHFARALIQARLSAAGMVEDVPSPTFTIVQTYDDGNSEIWHADLYRLTGPQEIEEIGLAEAFASAICIVEWPDRLSGLAPAGALLLKFAPGAGESDRDLTMESASPRWKAILKSVGHLTTEES